LNFEIFINHATLSIEDFDESFFHLHNFGIVGVVVGKIRVENKIKTTQKILKLLTKL
jgi:hypothetical protein